MGLFQVLSLETNIYIRQPAQWISNTRACFQWRAPTTINRVTHHHLHPHQSRRPMHLYQEENRQWHTDMLLQLPIALYNRVRFQLVHLLLPIHLHRPPPPKCAVFQYRNRYSWKGEQVDHLSRHRVMTPLNNQQQLQALPESSNVLLFK